MKRAALCLLVIVCGCSSSQRTDVNMSTPTATVETRYLALQHRDLDAFVKVYADPAWVKREEFLRIADSIVSSRILKTAPMDKSDPSASGEIYVLVEERYRGVEKPGEMNYVLRKVDANWLIVSFNAGEELPIDTKKVEREATKIK